jgi:hypothetical protein
VTGLTFGVIYDFKVESRNSHGYSDLSDPVSLLCAFIPDPPLTVTTTNSNELVTIDWSEPVNNGSPITAYRIFIRESDEATFTEETVQCVGSDVSVISNRQCSVTLALLQQAPYSLVKDD